jgi:sugar diacid utilization regulator
MAQDPAAVEMHQGIPFDALLAEPLLNGCVVVAGASRFHEPLSWCLPLSEAETRDQPLGLGELDLLGVAVHVPMAKVEGQRVPPELVCRLARRGAAALMVWPGPGGAEVDLRSAAAAAEKAGTPLVLLPAAADFRRLGQLVAVKVLAQTTHVLEYSARVHRTLGEVFAHGSGLAAMARTMSQLSRTPVYLLGLNGEVLASADIVRGEGAVAIKGPGPAVVARVIEEHREERARAEAANTVAPHARVLELELDDLPVPAMAAPVSVAGDAFGLVVLVEGDWPAEEHDLAQHAVIAEQGATLVGSELLRQRSVREAEERARDDFVDALLHGRFSDQHELAARARHYNFDPERRYSVFVISSRGLAHEPGTGPSRAAAATRAAGRASRRQDRVSLTAMIGSMIVVILQLPPSRHRDALAERQGLHQFADQLHRAVRDRLVELGGRGDDVRVSYGRSGVGAPGVARSYREARTALALAQRVGAPVVCGYHDLRVFAAIEELTSSPSGRSFAAEVLGPLRRADGQTGNLEEIVLAYIKGSGNLNAAARTLQLHRNTMLYKLDRASRALEMDIRSAETQFMVWLAHHIDALSQVHAALDNELAPPS